MNAIFTPNTITINGITRPASYSATRTGKVYIFTTANNQPVRILIQPGEPEYAAALTAARPEAAAAEPEAPAAPAAEPEAPAAPTAEPEAPAAPTAEPEAPAAPAAEPEAPAAPAKAYAGTTITGNGWKIVFDAAAARTRVILAESAPEAARAAVLEARFFWSSAAKSYNKKLTNKAHRAALALADQLRSICC